MNVSQELENEFDRSDNVWNLKGRVFIHVCFTWSDNVRYGSSQYVKRSQLIGRKFVATKDHHGHLGIELLDGLGIDYKPPYQTPRGETCQLKNYSEPVF